VGSGFGRCFRGPGLLDWLTFSRAAAIRRRAAWSTFCGAVGALGGNLDNKELVAGSTLCLPIHVPGALLSVGDGYGLQGMAK
jgi:acetamidase/formamidase